MKSAFLSMIGSNRIQRVLAVAVLITMIFSQMSSGMELNNSGSEIKKPFSDLASVMVKHPIATGATLCVGAGCAATFAYYWNKKKESKPTTSSTVTASTRKPKVKISSHHSPASYFAFPNYLWRNTQYLLGTAASWIGVTSLYRYFKNEPQRLAVLKASQSQKLHAALSEITDDALDRLYKETGTGPRSLYIPKEELFGANDKPIDLKQFFEKHGIVTVSQLFRESFDLWSNEDWTKGLLVLIKRSEGKEKGRGSYREKVRLNELSELLHNAKPLLKAFLPTETNEAISLEKLFIEKYSAFGRLLTYARLQKVIEEKKLSHVHLPLKILVIQDKKTGNYMTHQAASKILDDSIKITAFRPGVTVKVAAFSNDYVLRVFAERQTRYSVDLSQAAFDDLKTLITIAPFDVGIDNIFSDSRGDAVIIDTEFKDEDAEGSIAKLDRYTDRYKNLGKKK